MDLPAQLGGYVLEQRLHKSPLVDVYLGRATTGLSRRVLIKRLHAGFADDPEFVEAFRASVARAAALEDARVLHTLELGEHDGAPFLVTAFVDGLAWGSLLERVRAQGGRLPVAHALKISLEVARALAYAHGTNVVDGGLVHGDVGPESVWISREGQVRLADFGIVAAAVALHPGQDAMIRGSGGYLAPEQARGEGSSARSDQFCLGILLWESLCGERLFFTGNPVVDLRRVMSADIAPPSTKRPDVPAELDALVLRALHRKPADRFADCAAMAEALGVALGNAAEQPHLVDLGAWVSGALDGALPRAGGAAEVTIPAAASSTLIEDEGGQGGPPSLTAEAPPPGVSDVTAEAFAEPTEEAVAAFESNPTVEQVQALPRDVSMPSDAPGADDVAPPSDFAEVTVPYASAPPDPADAAASFEDDATEPSAPALTSEGHGEPPPGTASVAPPAEAAAAPAPAVDEADAPSDAADALDAAFGAGPDPGDPDVGPWAEEPELFLTGKQQSEAPAMNVRVVSSASVEKTHSKVLVPALDDGEEADLKRKALLGLVALFLVCVVTALVVLVAGGGDSDRAVEPLDGMPTPTERQPRDSDPEDNADPARGPSTTDHDADAEADDADDAESDVDEDDSEAPDDLDFLGDDDPLGTDRQAPRAGRDKAPRGRSAPDRTRAEELTREATRALVTGADPVSVKRTLDKARSADPRYPDVYRGLAVVAQRRDRPERALSLYKTYLRLAPDAPDRDAVTRMMGDLEAAAAQAKRARAEALWRRATQVLLTGNAKGARKILLKAKRKDPLFPAVHRSLGMVSQQLGDRDSARTYFKRYLELEPTAPDRKKILQFMRGE